ncbi:MAG TPA: VWA domain-containing protein [Blastocatellia bacterium]|nr:VWA domain-containing protein [Blastocatellia bacterium]
MKGSVSSAIAALILIAQPLSVASHQSQKKSDQEVSIKLRAEEVLVDAIVTDKKNRTVPDLTAPDFEILEDGVQQKIVSFRYESKSADITAGDARQANAVPTDIKSVNLVSLVLDAQTTRDGALRARRAALDYIDNGMKPSDFVAVFGMDLGLIVLAPFTNDKAAIREAVNTFTAHESKKYLATANQVKAQLESIVEPLSDASKIAAADAIHDPLDLPAEPPTQDVKGGSDAIDANQVMRTTIALTGLRILRTFDRYEREYQGWRSVSALLAIINAQKNVKVARKTLILFSEGFAVLPAVKNQYLSIISAANTSGVTIYALDIAGLRLSSPNAEAMQERDAAAVGRLRNRDPELVSGGTSALGRTEEIARMNNVTTLDELSEETGGYTIKNTNELSDGFRKIMDELGDHYTMTYLPSNQKYNGDFRHISVRLTRPGEYRIRARRGYYALRTLDDAPVLSQEVPLLDQANSGNPSQDFPAYADALHFRGTERSAVVALYCLFPVSALHFDVDQKAKTFASRFGVLGLIRNSSNEIVRKVGQEFVLKGPSSQLEEIKQRPQIYNKLVLLPPGDYTLDTVIRDSVTGKGAVARSRFSVPDDGPDKLSMSSVVLSRGVNALTEEQKKTRHPLYLEGQAYFVPNIEQTFSQNGDKNLLIHFNVYEPAGFTSPVNATLSFVTKAGVFTEASGALPPPDANGRVPYSTSFRTSDFPPGDYDLKVTVSAGSQRTSSVAHFKIQQ